MPRSNCCLVPSVPPDPMAAPSVPGGALLPRNPHLMEPLIPASSPLLFTSPQKQLLTPALTLAPSHHLCSGDPRFPRATFLHCTEEINPIPSGYKFVLGGPLVLGVPHTLTCHSHIPTPREPRHPLLPHALFPLQYWPPASTDLTPTATLDYWRPTWPVLLKASLGCLLDIYSWAFHKDTKLSTWTREVLMFRLERGVYSVLPILVPLCIVSVKPNARDSQAKTECPPRPGPPPTTSHSAGSSANSGSKTGLEAPWAPVLTATSPVQATVPPPRSIHNSIPNCFHYFCTIFNIQVLFIFIWLFLRWSKVHAFFLYISVTVSVLDTWRDTGATWWGWTSFPPTGPWSNGGGGGSRIRA